MIALAHRSEAVKEEETDPNEVTDEQMEAVAEELSKQHLAKQQAEVDGQSGMQASVMMMMMMIVMTKMMMRMMVLMMKMMMKKMMAKMILITRRNVMMMILVVMIAMTMIMVMRGGR